MTVLKAQTMIDSNQPKAQPVPLTLATPNTNQTPCTICASLQPQLVDAVFSSATDDNYEDKFDTDAGLPTSDSIDKSIVPTTITAELQALRERSCASLAESARIIRYVLQLHPRRVHVILLNSLLDEIGLVEPLAHSFDIASIQDLNSICSDLVKEVVQHIQQGVDSKMSCHTMCKPTAPSTPLDSERLSSAQLSQSTFRGKKCSSSADALLAAATFDDV